MSVNETNAMTTDSMAVIAETRKYERNIYVYIYRERERDRAREIRFFQKQFKRQQLPVRIFVSLVVGELRQGGAQVGQYGSLVQ